MEWYGPKHKDRNQKLEDLVNYIADALQNKGINVAEALLILERAQTKIKKAEILEFIDPMNQETP